MWMLLLQCTVRGAKIRACLEKFRDVAKKDDIFRRVVDGSTIVEQESVWPLLQILNPDIGPCQTSPDAVMRSAAVPLNQDGLGTQVVAVSSPRAQVDRVAGMQLFKRSDSLASSVSITSTALACSPEPSLCQDTCEFRVKCANVMNQVCVKIHVNFASSVQMT